MRFGTIKAPEPGIYEDVPFEDYLEWDCPSQSLLSLFRNRDLCELDVLYRIMNPPKQTPQMELGHLLEAAVDDPDSLGANIRCLPEDVKVRRGKAWEQLRDRNPNITFLPQTEWQQHKEQVGALQAMAKQVNLVAGGLLDGAKRQVSFVADLAFVGESGETVTHRVKGRLDYWIPKVILDLKSTYTGGQRAVGRTMWDFAYDVQSALYTDAMNLLTGEEHKFLFIVCRTSPPYPVTIYDGHNTTEMANQFLSIGRRSYQTYLERIAGCVREDRWRGYFSAAQPDDAILDIELPSWAGQEY